MVPTVDIPIPSFPDPREWFINGWNALLDYVFGSPSDAMKEMTRTVAEAQHADLNSPNIEWFKTIYNDVAGLAVVLALLGAVGFLECLQFIHQRIEFAHSALRLCCIS